MIIHASRIASVLVIAPPPVCPGAGCDRSFVAGLRQQPLPVHSITSSARSSIDLGNEMPKAFAVLRLMINSTLVTF